MRVRLVRVLVVLGLAAASLSLVPPLAAQTAAVEWSQVGSSIDGVGILERGDSAGAGVSLSSDGSRVAVGYPYNDTAGVDAGAVRVFEVVDGAWVLLGAVILGAATGDQFGERVSLSDDGGRVAVGTGLHDPLIAGSKATNAGQVRVFELNAGGYGVGAGWW